MVEQKKIATVIVPSYNEEDNIPALFERVEKVFEDLDGYTHEYIFIDNASTDRTPFILEELAKKHSHVKVIFNARNFGHIRSPVYGILQSEGDVTIFMVADLQDPPEKIPEILKAWEEGNQIVMCVKTQSKETWAMFMVRKLYYWIVGKLAEVDLVKNFYGFGAYDRLIIKELRKYEDPYPYFRGQLCELGFNSKQLEYTQERRARGFSKNNFYSLVDNALLGITYHSKVPLRFGIFAGFFMAFLSFLIGIGYGVAKIMYWDSFSIGVAPLILGTFFFFSLNLIFLGIIGEYIGNIYTQVLKRPLVVERKRLNFDSDEEKG
ncbi:MAG: glycosyltransferase family 2 protein [SAR324 cluster bacterium]|nr:glycosyltransferase family 2 protein [SAR324 cluster bacterium]